MTRKLFPKPRYCQQMEGTCRLNNGDYIILEERDKDEFFEVVQAMKQQFYSFAGLSLSIHVINTNLETSFHKAIRFERNERLEKEEYTITIAPTGVKITYSSKPGAFYAMTTLKQLIQQQGTELMGIEIHDNPQFPVRGFMLDISRNKMPSLETLFQVVDLMADVKLNHFQLYLEGVTFAFPSHASHWQDHSPLTAEEVLKLDQYCKRKCIDLAPLLNTFGHQEGWLTKREFNDLAECPDGYAAPWGYQKPNTFNPIDEQTISFFSTLIDELTPHFSSDYFNACCDETFELGLGKSREECERIGVGRVYLNYIERIYQELKNRGKTMMLANDIILKYEQFISELPKDIVILEWGYEGNHPFEKECEVFKNAGIPFIMMPGCSGWNSIAGRTANMRENLQRASEQGMEYGAIGMLNSEWGDNGHWQNLPVCFPGLVYGAAVSWDPIGNKEADIADYLNRCVFMDENEVMGDFILKLGDYYLLESEHVHNNTLLVKILYADLYDMNALYAMNERNFRKIERYIDKLERDGLNKSRMGCEDASLIMEEYRHALQFLRHAIALGRIKCLMKEGKASQKKQLLMNLEEASKDISALIHAHRILWVKRNRMDGLSESTHRLERLKDQYEKEIASLITHNPQIPVLENSNHF